MTLVERLSGCPYVAVYLLAGAELIGGPALLGTVAGLGLLAFVALRLPALPPAALAAGCLLAGLGLLALPLAEVPATLLAAAEKTTPFLLLFGAVALLQQPAAVSPALHAVGHWVTHQPPGRRFSTLAGGGFLLGAALNLAGMALVAALLPRSLAPAERRRLLMAILRGFQGAVCWSPLFVAMVAVLTVLPQLAWSQVLPFALAGGLLIPLSAWSLDRLRRRPPALAGVERPALDRRALSAILAVFALMAAILVALVAGAGLPIILALGVMAPPFALAWQWRIAGRGEGLRATAGGLAGRVFPRLPQLHREAFLFLAANLLGLGLAAWLDPRAIATVADLLPAMLEARLTLLALFGVGLSAVGVHPVVFVVVVGEVLTPASLGLPAPLLAALLTVIWALGTSVSPFSASSLQMARIAGISVFTLAWRWCGPLTVLLTLLVPLLMAALSRVIG